MRLRVMPRLSMTPRVSRSHNKEIGVPYDGLAASLRPYDVMAARVPISDRPPISRSPRPRNWLRIKVTLLF